MRRWKWKAFVCNTHRGERETDAMCVEKRDPWPFWETLVDPCWNPAENESWGWTICPVCDLLGISQKQSSPDNKCPNKCFKSFKSFKSFILGKRIFSQNSLKIICVEGFRGAVSFASHVSKECLGLNEDCGLIPIQGHFDGSVKLMITAMLKYSQQKRRKTRG